MKDIIRIHVSRQGEEELFRFLAQRNVIFLLARMNQVEPDPANSIQTIEVVRQVSTSASVGSAIVAWMKARAARNAVISTTQGDLVHARELDTGELERHLDVADQISLIETGCNHRPDKVEPLVDG